MDREYQRRQNEVENQAYLFDMFFAAWPVDEDSAQIIIMAVCEVTLHMEARVALLNGFGQMIAHGHDPEVVARAVYTFRETIRKYRMDAANVVAAAEAILPGIATAQAMKRIEQEESAERVGCTVALIVLMGGWIAVALTDGPWWTVIGWAAFCIGLSFGCARLHTILTRKGII